MCDPVRRNYFVQSTAICEVLLIHWPHKVDVGKVDTSIFTSNGETVLHEKEKGQKKPQRATKKDKTKKQ